MAPSKVKKRTPKKLKQDEGQPKITKFMSKENIKKVKPLNVTKVRKKDYYEKYGVRVPSFEKILADHKKFDKYKEGLKKLDDLFDDNVLTVRVNNDCLVERKFEGEMLDCRSLRRKELRQCFEKFCPVLEDIMGGGQKSERHNKFHSLDPKLVEELRYCPSLVVFEERQREYLLDLLKMRFDPKNENMGYFFQVLLPEVCLLIFMDMHHMRKRRAIKYLEQRPLDL